MADDSLPAGDSVQFTFPRSSTDILQTGQLQHPPGWAVEVILEASETPEGTAGGPAEPDGRFVTAEELLPIRSHVVGEEGWAYFLHGPSPYRVRFTTTAVLIPGVYRIGMTFFADWRYDFGDERLPPDSADHGQVRFIIGDETTEWLTPAHLQINRLEHDFSLSMETGQRLGFEVVSRVQATSNGLYLQSFSVQPSAEGGLEALELHRVVVNLLPQSATLREKWHVLFRTHDQREAILQSHDDALNLVRQGRDDSFIRLWGRDRFDTDQLAAIAGAGVIVRDEKLSGVTLVQLPPSTLEEIPAAVVNLLSQDATLLEKWHVLQVTHAARQSMMQSHDDAILLMQIAGPGSHVRLWARERFQPGQLATLAENGIVLVDESFPPPAPIVIGESGEFRLTHWPSTSTLITQPFNVNPEWYVGSPFPAHEGIDIGAAFSSPIFAAADGTVIANPPRPPDKPSGYGIHIRIEHAGGFQTLYGHLERTEVEVGKKVKGGDIIGFADSTGNVRPKPSPENPHAGAHLHFSIRLLNNQPTIFPLGYVDPTPFLRQLPQFPPDAISPPPPPVRALGRRIDLLDYLRGDGRLYEVRSESGAQERFQNQNDAGRFFVVKNSNWEELWADDNFIWRGFDTSPDNERYYIQIEEARDGARWANRRMQIGETFRGFGHHVQFYLKSDCSKSERNSGRATNQTTLHAHHDSKTWNNITVKDVIELKGIGGESYFFARGFGLVGWVAPWGSSGVNEVHAPGARPDNVRLRIPCMKRHD